MIQSIYLAYPIDQVGPRAASTAYLWDQIEVFKRRAANHVSWIFDPGDAFKVNPSLPISEGLALINRVALGHADAVVAFLPEGIASVGVPIEIDRARAQGKPVLVISNVRSFMLEMPGVARLTDWGDEALDDGLDWLLAQVPYDGVQVHGDLLYTGDEKFAPIQTYGDDAGYDLVVSEDTVIPAGQFVDVPCGISVELPERVWAMITGRSSTLRKRGLLVSTGIIDTGYRGPLFAGVQNLDPKQEVWVKTGERIAQLLLFNNTTMRYRPLRVPELTPSARGANGFGSTGS